MKLTVKNIRDLVAKRMVIRGINPLELTLTKLDQICDIAMDEIQSSIFLRGEPEWYRPWQSLRSLNENKAKKRFKSIPRFEKLIERMITNLKRSHPIKVSCTRNIGAEYVYLVSKQDSRDYCDWVHVPHPWRFNSNKLYYKTFIHELGHAACSRNRLCFKFVCKDEEELAVESTAAIISFLLGINVWDNAIGYMQDRSYGTLKDKNQNVLCIKTKKQWKNVRNKTKRILRYLLIGREKMDKMFQ